MIDYLSTAVNASGASTTAASCARGEDRVAALEMDRPVRVCFMLDKLAAAGIELQLLLLLNRLDRSRVAPFLCLLDGSDSLPPGLAPDDCPVIRLGVRRLRRPSSLMAALRLARFLRRERIDVLHPLFPDSTFFGTPVARLARVPCVAWFCVDLGFWMGRADRWAGRFLRRWADGTVANCAACRAAVKDNWGVAADSVAIIPNGVDLSRFAVRRAQVFSDSGAAKRRVGIVANLRAVKNLPLLIRVAAQLAPAHPDLRFAIAGEGECRSKLQALIDSLGLRDRVALRGSVADIPAFLERLDIAVLCSLSEGSPNAIMEYMAAGLPTVVTDVGGNAELVEHDVTGLVVPSDDDASLAAAIDRLLRNPALAARMGSAGRSRAFAEFGVETQSRRYEEFYCNLLRKKCPK